MQRTIAISDVHGCVTELNELLTRMKYSPGRDRLLLLGDYVDRGPHSRQTVDRAMELVSEGAIALRGNHDQRLVDLAEHGDPATIQKFIQHGGVDTASSYLDEAITMETFMGYSETMALIDRLRERLNNDYAHQIAFLRDLPLYVEDSRHIFVHAGIHPDYFTDWKQQPTREFMYVKQPFWNNRTGLPAKVVFGHTRAVELHGRPSVWFGQDKIGIDGGCAYGQQLNGLEITDSGYAVWSVSSRMNREKAV